jgi:hypothetical protein
MPLTQDNLALLPPGFYDNFCSLIENTAKEHNVSFIDLAHSNQFNKSDFWDTSHLDQDGGKKVISAIMPALSKELRAFSLAATNSNNVQ